MSARNSQKKLNPKKCANCQRRNLPRKTISLCPNCFELVNIETQLGITNTYRHGQELDLRLSEEFSAFMDSAIAQAAMGTLAAKPQGNRFVDKHGSPFIVGQEAWLTNEFGRFKVKILRLLTETGRVSTRRMSHPPDVEEVSPKDLEVIHERQRDEHPED